jgi:YfiR/HmsC-like
MLTMMRRPSLLLLTILGLLSLGLAVRPARADTPLEQQVKSAFVANFVQFIDWPDSAFTKADDPLIIGVADPAALGDALKAAVDGKTVKGRKLLIQQFTPSTVGKCHILLTGGLDGADLDAALKNAKSCGILTIGDAARFTDSGGVIQFYLEDRKVRFEINLAAAQRAKLQISSQLLKLARVVNK